VIDGIQTDHFRLGPLAAACLVTRLTSARRSA